MYKNKTVFMVVPAYDEESQISTVLASSPDFIDRIVVVNDGSRDHTSVVVRKAAESDRKIVPLDHEKNKGVGAARFTGFRYAIEQHADLIVALDGDAQMDSSEIQHLLDPLVAGEADFTKANRLASGEAWKVMPRFRFFCNAILTLLTKIASGYWHITDPQAGFFALTGELARHIDYDHIYPRYGCENELLIHLSVLNARVKDVPSKPIYKIGEVSRIRIWKDWFPLVCLLRRGFFWRIFQKYVVRDFHPLVFFYFTGIIVSSVSVFYLMAIIAGRVFVSHMDVSLEVRNLWLYTLASPLITVMDLVFILLGLQMLFFAMWMDMQESQRLKEGNPNPFLD